MLATLRDCRAKVLVSGYASGLYDDALSGWRRVEIAARADRGASRTEVLWLNFADDVGLFSEQARQRSGA